MSIDISLQTYLASLSVPEVPAECILAGEAADLDSVVSSLMYAYFRSTFRERPAAAVIPIPRKDIMLRREVVCLFHEADLDPQHLLFLDDPHVQTFLLNKENTFTLIDHSQAPEHLGIPAEQIRMILDHHPCVIPYPHAENMSAPVGSTATLISELFLSFAPGQIDTQGALLLAGTILLDTAGLDETSGRCTCRDQSAAAHMLQKSKTKKNSLYQMLEAAKFSIDGLSSSDILRRDCKKYNTADIPWAVSSVPLSFEQWETIDPAFPSVIRSYASRLSCRLFAVMAAFFQGGEFFRQAAFHAAEIHVIKQTAAYLEEKGMVLETLEINSAKGAQDFLFFCLPDPSWSRKFVQPLLSEFFSGLSS